MKRITSILMLSLVIALSASVAQAAKPNKANKPERPNRAAKQEQRGIAGIVQTVNDTSITVQTRGKQGAEVTVAVDGNTKFEGVTSIKEVKQGMRVIATPATGTAQKIIVREAGKGAEKRPARKPKNNQ
jgi:predicted secreted protein